MPLNIALIGTGGIVEHGHVQAVTNSSSVQLWSVLSRSLERARQFAELHGAASPIPAYDSLDSLLSDKDLDAVIIATPDKLHCEQAVAAAEAGKASADSVNRHVDKILEKISNEIITQTNLGNIRVTYTLDTMLAHSIKIEVVKRIKVMGYRVRHDIMDDTLIVNWDCAKGDPREN